MSDTPTRFRIRMGSEQISLPQGATLIGRDGTSCRITIFDTLISRRHARIQVDGERASVEDLGSRNGTRLNGIPISGPHAIRDGDRIGIGGNELVVQVVDANDSEWDSPTGLIRVCPECQAAYSATQPVCPGCGAESTGSGAHARSDDTSRGRWSIGMLVEMLGKSMLTGRTSEVEKLMRQVATVVSDELREQKEIDPEELRILGEVASWLDKAQRGNAWSKWMADTTLQLQSAAKRARTPPR